MEEEVSLDSIEETERLVGWACKVSMMGLQREIFLRTHALKKEWEQKILSFEEGSSLKPLRQGSSSTAQLQKSRERKTGMHLHPLKSTKNWRLN